MAFHDIALWLLVISLGIQTGAGLFETRVLVPLWASSPPQSVLAYLAVTIRPDSGHRLWIFLTPLTGIISLLKSRSGLAVRRASANMVALRRRVGSLRHHRDVRLLHPGAITPPGCGEDAGGAAHENGSIVGTAELVQVCDSRSRMVCWTEGIRDRSRVAELMRLGRQTAR